MIYNIFESKILLYAIIVNKILIQFLNRTSRFAVV